MREEGAVRQGTEGKLMEPTTKQVSIDWDADLSKFLIRCPFWANEHITRIPARRWLKPKGAWACPPTRRNEEFIRTELIGPGYAVLSDAARRVMEKIIDKTAAYRQREFPSWYKYKTSPRKHQVAALNKIYGLPAHALFQDRGTGKTKIEIDVGCAMRMENKIDAMLVAVKLSGRRTWAEQFELHAPIPYSLMLANTDEGKAFSRWLVQPHDFKVMCIGIESLSQGRMIEFAEQFLRVHINPYMVIDESHLISNHRAIRSVACLRLGKLAKYRAVMTGTPISTGPMNLFMQFEFLDPDIIGIGDYYSFRNRYAVMGGYQVTDRRGNKHAVEIVGYQHIDELTKTVAPVTVEVRKSDVLDLPPKVYKKSYVQLAKKQRELYDKVRREGTYAIKGREHTVSNVLELALRLHQIAGGFITTYSVTTDATGREKRVSHINAVTPWRDNPKIIELLDICGDDKQFMIWCAYLPEIRAVVEALRATYPKEEIVEIHGAIPEADRHHNRVRYQKGLVKYAVGNTATGGTSDTWTACETMIYYNNTERMIDREQSEDRAHRDGLKHSVLYIDVIAEKTVDETIIKSLAMKVDLSEYIRMHIRDVASIL